MRIDGERHAVTSEIRNVFQKQSDVLMKEEGRNILVSHFGTFSQDLVMSLSQGVEDLLVSIGDRRIIIKRIFSILIEGLQNIRRHGEIEQETNRQLSYFIMAGEESSYKLMMGNIVLKENEDRIRDYIDRINGYSPEELKSTYNDVLQNEFLSNKGGAGLGFITTRMKSGNPLQYEFFDLGPEQALFTINVQLNRVNV